MSNVLKNRTWRYATKKFDANKRVSDTDLELLLEATRLSASSYGLQPYHVFVITDPEIKAKLRPVSWNQSQITDASHIIVFANITDFGEELLDGYMKNVSDTRNIPEESLKGYGDFMKSKLLNLSEETKNIWTIKQVYIALGNMMQAAAELEIDTCPMEGFESEAYNEILGLDEKDLNASVVLAVGYRSDEDETQHYAKVRKSKEELFTHI
ncbi:NAD(P)H-dependent oxidoreductase [Muricauda sp. 2012CJ35-5]|uniref:NAD(P)H-dependent oxidoreductase n=1 Tax=Flagellimonas spongiicola TaxID=2942208 RepID=A0ABT0PX03_9FLAO|nr:NAD(P)H-dependent oxidoreductase [Allomuricauda spongiicola]MCL6275257.1 NAD(P)H-dependent oxidoreductase [Allomuricauda spongiicola]